MADYNRSITVEDLLRRYNLEGLQRDRNRVYQLQGELTNTNGILEDFVDVTTQNIDLIKDQLDGNVTSWFYGYIPTMSNVPAVNWATDEVKKEHLEDLFYNTDTGKVYKFTNEEGNWSWKEVTNIVGAQTLAVANASQDILDGNRRTFVVQPTPPYDVGDLWTDNTNHILYRCRTEKLTGETFSMDDWVDSLKYLTNDGDVIIDSINSSKTTKTISAKNLFLEGDIINMTSKKLAIYSDNFRVTKEGNLWCQNGSFDGYVYIDEDKEGSLGREHFNIHSEAYDGTPRGSYDKNLYLLSDGISIEHLGGNDGTHSYSSGLDTKCNAFQSAITLTSEYAKRKAFFNQNYLSFIDTSSVSDVTITYLDEHDLFFDSVGTNYGDDGAYVRGVIESTVGMVAPYFNPPSSVEYKKNIKKVDYSALDIVKNIDFYEYNYNEEEDNFKKHIGLIIGDDYKYSEKVTSDDNKKVDLYSFISVCCKAIQEQQKEIEELKEEINKLKKEE